MHFIGVIVAIVLGIGGLWLRAQRGRDSASGVVDPADRAKKIYSRPRFTRQAGISVLAGVEDAGSAAATLLFGLAAMKGRVTREDEEAIDQQLELVCAMSQRDRDEAIAFAASASGEVTDVNEIIRRFMPMWRNKLDRDEYQDLIDMAIRVVETGGAPSDAQKSSIKRLSEGLLLR